VGIGIRWGLKTALRGKRRDFTRVKKWKAYREERDGRITIIKKGGRGREGSITGHETPLLPRLFREKGRSSAASKSSVISRSW